MHKEQFLTEDEIKQELLASIDSILETIDLTYAELRISIEKPMLKMSITGLRHTLARLQALQIRIRQEVKL